MKLWQGWHNTDLGRSYFHYGPFGGTKKQMGILAQTCKKRGVKKTSSELYFKNAVQDMISWSILQIFSVEIVSTGSKSSKGG